MIFGCAVNLPFASVCSSTGCAAAPAPLEMESSGTATAIAVVEFHLAYYIAIRPSEVALTCGFERAAKLLQCLPVARQSVGQSNDRTPNNGTEKHLSYFPLFILITTLPERAHWATKDACCLQLISLTDNVLVPKHPMMIFMIHLSWVPSPQEF